MPSRVLAAIVCAFVPCSAFFSPVQPVAPSVAGGPGLGTPCKDTGRSSARLPGLLRPCRVQPQSVRDGAGALAAAGPRSGRRLARSSMMMAVAGGGEGGCETEGEVGEGGAGRAESLPIARTEEHDALDSGGTDEMEGKPFGSANAPAVALEGRRGAEEGGSGDGAGELHATAGDIVADDMARMVGEGAGSDGAAGAASAVVGAMGSARERRRGAEAPLPEREGFALVKKLLPGGGEGLEMDVDRLRSMRSEVNQLKRTMRKAAEEGDYLGSREASNAVAAIRAKDPLCVVSKLLGVAVSKEKFKRAGRLKDAKDWIVRESGEAASEVNRLVCLGNKASNVITTDLEGSDIRRFLDTDEVKEISKTGQIQLPVWSPDGKMLAFCVLKAGSRSKANSWKSSIESSRILVFRERGDLALDVAVPFPPFLLLWAPNSQSLTYLSNANGPGPLTTRLSEVMVTAAKTPFKTKTRGLAQGNPVFYAYTKKNMRSADMVVHTSNRVYFLDMSTGKEVDMTSTAADLFMAPSTHCEGGEDAAILVEVGSGDEGQHLVSARVDGSAKKRLCPTRGFSTFGVSPDGRRVCLMQQDVAAGFYTISVLEGGEGALDPLSTATMEQVEIPLDRVIMGFFFSPDSKKLLCLVTEMSKDEVAVAQSSKRLGFELKFQWAVYDCETRKVQMLAEFTPRQFFLKMYIPYFDMFAQGFTPWAPDSKSFAYVTEDSAFVQDVPDEGSAKLPQALGPNMEFVSWSYC